MKKIGIITYDRTPYRIFQLNRFNKNYEITAYYTAVKLKNRNWNLQSSSFSEKKIDGIFLSKGRNLWNFGLSKIVSHNDVIIVGGFDSATSIALSIICKIRKKPFILLIDGIAYDKQEKKISLKWMLKKIVIKNAMAIFANGQKAKKYLNNNFSYPEDQVYNQFLSVDNDAIYNAKNQNLNTKMSNVFKNAKSKKILYSGRLLEVKNVKIILEAINLLEYKNQISLIVLGDGPEADLLLKLSEEYEIQLIITGFISEQEQLFASYYYGDMLILPSLGDAWGLVVNEAMAAGLPVIVSDKVGCSDDLVNIGENGYVFDSTSAFDLSKYIDLIYNNNPKLMGLASKKIIRNWTFEASFNEFDKMIHTILPEDN